MPNEAWSLIVSFIGMSFAVASYFVKNKSLYLLFQAICILFLILSYFFTAQFFAMIGLGVGLLRAVVFFLYERKQKTAPLWIAFALSALTIGAYFIVNLWILGTASLYDVLYVIALVLYVFIFRIRNLKTVRFAMLVPTVFSILYTMLTQAALFTLLTYVFELVADVVSIFKYHVIKKPHAKEK